MRDREPSVPLGTISNQHAWLVVAAAMALHNLGRISRAESERLMDMYFARIDEAAGRMYPETANSK
jgi:hypothetical protein